MTEPATAALLMVAHNSGPMLLAALRSASAARCVQEIVLIDNASSDDAFDAARAAFREDARFRAWQLPINLGFGAACNRAASDLRSDWLLILNPDCLVDADILDQLLSRAPLLASPGVITLAMNDPQGRPERAAHRLLPNCRRLLFGPRRPPPLPAGDPCPEIEAGSGALMLLERRLFAQLQGFDERFFLHAEDLDLMARARALGRCNRIAADLPAVHHQGGSSGARPWFVSWQKHRNLLRFLNKHGRGLAERLCLPLLALALLLHFGWTVIRGGARR